ncbi:hypothetical protein ACFOYU_10225 [Microvirga sp. GCM10011540]|uniref:hypothetical protein n=1 Tax=Microvirga sp. GCM10011540 TaxID=3317338 RepID=UPI00360B0975
MPHLPRLMLSCLMVAILSIALVGTAWHGAAQAGTSAPHTLSASGGHQHMGQPQAGDKHAAASKHATPGKAHAAGQGCCHPACTAAVIPCPAGTAPADRLAAALRMSRDREPGSSAPSGLDRPPKHA